MPRIILPPRFFALYRFLAAIQHLVILSFRFGIIIYENYLPAFAHLLLALPILPKNPPLRLYRFLAAIQHLVILSFRFGIIMYEQNGH